MKFFYYADEIITTTLKIALLVFTLELLCLKKQLNRSSIGDFFKFTIMLNETVEWVLLVSVGQSSDCL